MLPEHERDLAGRWEHKSTNPFEMDMWLPLSEPLLSQEKFVPSLPNVSIQLSELINEDHTFDFKTSPALFGEREVPQTEPSQQQNGGFHGNT